MTHRILKSGHIELREVKEDGGFHRRVIAPNEPAPTEYKEQLESDENFSKYRTQENASAYEFQLLADQPSESEMLDQWRKSFKTDLYKLKITLENRGELDAIETLVSQQAKQVQLAWANTPRVRRDSPTVASLATAMGYTDEVLDEIFKQADQVQL